MWNLKNATKFFAITSYSTDPETEPKPEENKWNFFYFLTKFQHKLFRSELHNLASDPYRKSG